MRGKPSQPDRSRGRRRDHLGVASGERGLDRAEPRPPPALAFAECMREHDVPQFPDPRTSVPRGFKPNPGEYSEITNYMGAILLYPASIDQQSPAYQHATVACGAGFLAGNNAH